MNQIRFFFLLVIVINITILFNNYETNKNEHIIINIFHAKYTNSHTHTHIHVQDTNQFLYIKLRMVL